MTPKKLPPKTSTSSMLTSSLIEELIDLRLHHGHYEQWLQFNSQDTDARLLELQNEINNRLPGGVL